MPITSSDSTSPLYAVIDLGSNSFHMLITRQLANSVQIVDKVKRKVRLASGLDQKNTLNEKAMARGLECLSFFAERLQDIQPQNIRIVATATLRLAVNRQQFLQQAEKVLGYRVNLLSGKEEAEYIYQGVAHTCATNARRLVIDIGGASTELVIGDKYKALEVNSINMGCVTYKQAYFPNNVISENNFTQAILSAQAQLSNITDSYKNIGWEIALSGSGTMQALAEILASEHKPAIITLEYLQQLQREILQYNSIVDLQIKGLSLERIPVFPSGLAILIAIFLTLEVKELHLSDGALREGLLYEMLKNSPNINVRERTINSLFQRFHIDVKHAERVKKQVITLYEKFADDWQLKSSVDLNLLCASCDLHEIGLLLSFKNHQKHGAYIVQNVDLPGFNKADKEFISALILQYKDNIQPHLLAEQTAVETEKSIYLLIILRLAIIICRRRQDDVLPQYKAYIKNSTHISLALPKAWINLHPLIVDELQQENEQLKSVNMSLEIIAL